MWNQERERSIALQGIILADSSRHTEYLTGLTAQQTLAIKGRSVMKAASEAGTGRIEAPLGAQTVTCRIETALNITREDIGIFPKQEW